MLKRLMIPLTFLTGICFALVLFALLSPETREAAFLIKNESGSELTKVVLLHEKGHINIGELGAGQVLKVSVYASGESSAYMQATLPNGASLSSKGSYIEPGYCVVETIGPAVISSETKLFGCWL